MTKVISLSAETRQDAGKGQARTLRRAGRIPAIIYGQKQEAASISLNYRELGREYFKGSFFSRLCDLTVDGQTIRVLPYDVQLDPVTDFPIHADFLRVGADSQVKVNVPVHFINEEDAPGLKRGGMLAIVRHEVEVVCRAADIPEYLEADLTGLAIGDSIHISNIGLPAGVAPAISDRDFTVASITGIAVEIEEEEEEEAAAEEGEEAEETEEGEEAEESEKAEE